jgi:hypothetical protein
MTKITTSASVARLVPMLPPRLGGHERSDSCCEDGYGAAHGLLPPTGLPGRLESHRCNS